MMERTQWANGGVFLFFVTIQETTKAFYEKRTQVKWKWRAVLDLYMIVGGAQFRSEFIGISRIY